MPLLKENDKIDRKLVVERYLGGGKYGEVYRVRHLLFPKEHYQALKVITKPVKKFHEVYALSELHHKNIIRIFEVDIFEYGGKEYTFFTMEYIAGGTLEGLFHAYQNQTVPIDLAVDLIKQVCAGLKQAHIREPPIIHRDLKPQNIMLNITETGREVKIADFGLATELDPNDINIKTEGTIIFKAPEARSGEDSCAGDMWAVGMIFYLLLTKKYPYEIKSVDEVKTGICYQRALIPASELNKHVDKKLDEILERALNVNPKYRYRDAEEMLDDIVKWKKPSQKQLLSSEMDNDLSLIYSAFNEPEEEELKLKIEKTLKLAQDGQLGEATPIMENILNQDQDLFNKYFERLLLWKSENPSRALKAASQEKFKDGDLEEAIILLKEANANTDDPVEKKNYQKTLSLWTKDPFSLTKDAHNLANQGKFEDAVEILKISRLSTQVTCKLHELEFFIILYESFIAAREKDNLKKASELLWKAQTTHLKLGQKYAYRRDLWTAENPGEELAMEAEASVAQSFQTPNRMKSLIIAAELMEEAINQKEIYENQSLLESYRDKILKWRKGVRN